MTFELKPIENLTTIPGIEWDGSELKKTVGLTDSRDRDKIADYLENGYMVLSWMGIADDVIDGKSYIPGGMAIVTDGKFFWRYDAGKYVRVYGVAVPLEAIEHMRNNNWTPPMFTKSEEAELFDILGTYYGGRVITD